MQRISGDGGRATRGLDPGFVRYPMADEGIMDLIRVPCPKDTDVRPAIVGPIEDLEHRGYHGKRINLRITDSPGTSMKTKLDLGVHDKLSPKQDEAWLDTALQDEGIALMAVS